MRCAPALLHREILCHLLCVQAPELLQWRAGRGTVTAIKPGLYQLCVGFFSPTLPKITVFVDDHAAVSTTPR